MIGAEMMITVHAEKSFANATMIPSTTAMPRASLNLGESKRDLRALGLLTRATYHASGPIQAQPRGPRARTASAAAASSANRP